MFYIFQQNMNLEDQLFMFELDFLIQLSKFNFNLIIIMFIGWLFFDQLTNFGVKNVRNNDTCIYQVTTT